ASGPSSIGTALSSGGDTGSEQAPHSQKPSAMDPRALRGPVKGGACIVGRPMSPPTAPAWDRRLLGLVSAQHARFHASLEVASCRGILGCDSADGVTQPALHV